jgi:integrase/recombinase XerD
MSAYRTPDGRWRYQARVVINGKVERPSGSAPKNSNTKAAAIGAERAHIARLLNPTPEPAAAGKEDTTPTFREVASDYMRDVAPQELSLHEQDSKRRKLVHLERFKLRGGQAFGDLPVGSIGRMHVDAIRADLRASGKAMSTVNNNLAVIGAVLSYAVEREIITKRPRLGMFRINRRHQPYEVYREPEVAQLLVAAGDDVMQRAALLLGFDAGLRAGEIQALHRSDVVGNTLRIRFSCYKRELVPPKSGHARVVAMTKRLSIAVRAALLAHTGPRVLARLADRGRWKAAHGEPWTYEVMRMCAPAKGWHALRHGFVTRLLEAGASPSYVQEVVGHESINTTMRYSHPDEHTAANVTALLDPENSNAAPAATGAASTKSAQKVPKPFGRPVKPSETTL